MGEIFHFEYDGKAIYSGQPNCLMIPHAPENRGVYVSGFTRAEFADTHGRHGPNSLVPRQAANAR